MAPLNTLLSTVMLWNAAAARTNDDVAGAKDILQSAIEFFPGDPARREATEVGEGYNWENHLAYLRLSELLEGEAARTALANAIARCAVLELECLGDPASELAAATKHVDGLRARAKTILDTVAADPRADNEPGMRMAMSPIWRNVDGEVVRRLDILAGPAYSPGPLLANPALVEAAIEWLSSSSPLDVARLSRDTIQFWEGDSSEGQLKVLDEPYQAGDFLLSLALAHVARLAGANLTVDEVRAACELITDGAAAEGARNKLAKLEAAETAMLLAAMGLDPAASRRDA
jgi:hypothetical protein